MGNTQSSRSNRIDWLAKGPFAPHIDAYRQYLTDRGYATTTFSNCMRSIAVQCDRAVAGARKHYYDTPLCRGRSGNEGESAREAGGS